MSKLNEIIVSQLPIQSEVKPCTAYLLDNGDGTHDRYVSDEDGNLSKLEGGIKSIQAGSNITIDNTDPKNPIISSTGGILNEIDPIFSASPSATITNSDISNWNSKLSAEIDTLESVVNRGNYSPRYMTFTGTTSVPTRDGALGMNTNTYSMYFGNMNPVHTGTWNIGIGYNTLDKLTTGAENMAFGHYALDNLTVGTENIAIGNQTLNALAGTVTESRWNIAIGENVARNLSKASGNVFIGTYTAKNLTSSITEADLAAISPAAVAYMKSIPDYSGYNSTTATFNTALNTFVGHAINETTSTPTRAAMSTIIGASGLYNVKFRNFNNIIVGAGNYMTVANGTMYNSIVIGNSINLPNQVDVLSIGMNRNSRINSQDAIIYGLLPNTQLTFNAPITVPSTYMRNAQGDSAYTKQLVAKPNGDIGWEDKVSVTPRGSLAEFYAGGENITNTTADTIYLYNNDSGIRTITHTNFNTSSNNGDYRVVVRSGQNFKITPGNAGYSGVVMYKDGTMRYFGGSHTDSYHTLRSGTSYLFTEKPGVMYYHIFEI